MNALILAAGFGSRLLPYTNFLPKPLFTINNRAILDFIICKLISAGCKQIVVNTHYLHEQIEHFIANQRYRTPIYIAYEPNILGTGGAIKNLQIFWNNEPFIVINSDIFFENLKLEQVYKFHLMNRHIVTLVLTKSQYKDLNKVSLDKYNVVKSFDIELDNNQDLNKPNLYTFTGIQILSREIFDFISSPNIIDAYKKIIASNKKIKAFVVQDINWQDIGVPDRYKSLCLKQLIKKTICEELQNNNFSDFACKKLKGDGSDRNWFRINLEEPEKISFILADHGIINNELNKASEINSFVSIGNYLYNKNISVPKIYNYDLVSGFVLLEDLGDTHLESINNKDIYKLVIDKLIDMFVLASKDFDISWVYQSEHKYYDTNLILEKECKYFTDAFLNNYCGLNIDFAYLKYEFLEIAKNAVENSINGLMHRDFQSRNIMIKNNKIYFIDFQGARIGPIQYDLASLLIDPYVDIWLDYNNCQELINYCINKLACVLDFDKNKFIKGLNYCFLTRNFQILGAFAYLSKVKNKVYFEKYIPKALRTLKNNLAKFNFSKLTEIIKKIKID